jgi:uncharacterized repeat protein (TIGR03803 family)
VRVATSIACALTLAGCATGVPIPNPAPQQPSVIKPATVWLCGQPPSAAPNSGARPLAGTGYKSLYKFKASPDGGYPYGELLALGGKLYGTTDEGGAHGYGTIFELVATGQERVLYSFKNGNDGAYPCAGLVGVGGKLYGTTQAGGTTGWGTLFEASTSGA